MKNLGPVGITFAVVATRDELASMLPAMVNDLPAEMEGLDRIVLIVPERVAKELGWPAGKAPQHAIYKHDLVFSPPK